MRNDPNAEPDTVNFTAKANERQTPLNEGYRLMASDREREAEVDEWIDGLIADAD
jgi:hypothetical protein